MANIHSEKYIIDIDYQLKVRDFEKVEFKLKQKVYPLPCQMENCISSTLNINILKLKRTYKSICSNCHKITDSYNKNRVGICIECERNKSKLKVICYKCDKKTQLFKKDMYGFVCTDCDYKSTLISYCKICEYAVPKNISICEDCKYSVVRKPRLLIEKKVICCNCEQVAIQLNPDNENVYCFECKNDLINDMV